jgi:uncharacterized protein with PIN domain
MLGGLARWLRAVGYEAAFAYGIDDGVLVARAQVTGEIVLSSDQPLFARRPFRLGQAQGLFVPRHAPVLEQTVFVLRAFALEVRGVRCMACGGALDRAAPDAIAAEVPTGTVDRYPCFWRCAGCRRVYWQGTHWNRIEAQRAHIAQLVHAPAV